MVYTSPVSWLGEVEKNYFTRRHEGTKKAVLFRRVAPLTNALSKFRVSVDREMALRAKADPFASSCLRVNQKNPDLSAPLGHMR